ncbi:VOC family protein [Ulvibacterium sp.]|uniref:VOC family protein n=1 Tax=Ulvibacterium sp. TaxID=2665914 RepID=UPI003CC5F6BE
MEFDRTGIILFTINYEECVRFYKDVLGLPKLFEKEKLTFFAFGESYLLVEVDDEYVGPESTDNRVKTCLRMNVKNVKSLVGRLEKENIQVDYQEHSWGTIAKFHDPDGNLCAFKDSEKFEQQILDYKN